MDNFSDDYVSFGDVPALSLGKVPVIKKAPIESPWDHVKQIKFSPDLLAQFLGKFEGVHQDSKILGIQLDNSGKYVTVSVYHPSYSSKEIEKTGE